jgi:hypothetical protein
VSATSRTQRGFKTHRCYQCTSGIIPGQPKTFEPSCEGCHEKKAKGLRTGLEPRPPQPGNRSKKRIDKDKFLGRVESETAGRKESRS